MDKNGSLVVIENKLDDSGWDVVWQCLKYASYCSTLSKTNIVEMFQEFLGQNGDSNAQERICTFLGQEDFGEVVVNSGNDQRLIMVAAQFRKEVTSTVLWLLKHGVRVQCFKATPYQHGETLLLNLEQVIPLPEAEELMIGIAEKEKEEHSVERGLAARHVLRMEFWQKTLAALEAAKVNLYENVGPTKDNWLSAGSGFGGAHYSMVFAKDGVRVEFVLAHSTREKNKAMFDYLYAHRAEIEKKFGNALNWRRLDEYKVSIVGTALELDSHKGHEREIWPQLIEWLVIHVRKLEDTFEPEIGILRQLLRTDSPAKVSPKYEGQ